MPQELDTEYDGFTRQELMFFANSVYSHIGNYRRNPGIDKNQTDDLVGYYVDLWRRISRKITELKGPHLTNMGWY